MARPGGKAVSYPPPEWAPTLEFRWWRSPGTSSEPNVLQQRWGLKHYGGSEYGWNFGTEGEWRDVPLVVSEDKSQ